jgi:transposase
VANNWPTQGSHTINQIAQTLRVSRTCIDNTIKKWEMCKDVTDRRRSGQPRISTKRQDEKLLTLARSNPKWSILKLSQNWLKKNGKQSIGSRSTISRRLLTIGLESFEAINKPLLTRMDRARRLAWCKERVNWTYQQWAKVIFSDESNFQLVNRKNRQLVRRFANEKYDSRFVSRRVQAGGGSIGIWGCINYNGFGLCYTYTNRLNQVTYLDILENTMIPSRDLLVQNSDDWYFQQDNAPCHTARSIQAWFEENEVRCVKWPRRSPDLNPIEHVWNEIDKKLFDLHLSNLGELEEALRRIWNGL